MPFPTHEEVLQMFRLLEDPPQGSQEFFQNHVSPGLTFHAVGPPGAENVFSRYSKEDFLQNGFGKLSKAVRAPGLKFRLVDDGAGMVVDEQRGTAAVMFDTVDTVTHSGVLYQQHYSWHMRFDNERLITHIWAFLDHRHLEDVLGAELKRLGEA